MSKKIKLSNLTPDERNNNKHTAYGMDLLEKSVNKVGIIESITVSNDDKIISGNARHEVIGKNFDKEALVIETDGTQPIIIKRTDIESDTKKFYEASILANTTAKKNIDFDIEVIENIATDFDIDIVDLGVDIVEDEHLEAEEDDFEVPEGGIETDIVLGDLFEIGEHRLLCGDSTDSDQIDKLMNGNKAEITFTSPPYNAGDNSLGGNKNKVDNKYETYDDEKEQGEWMIFVSDVLKNCLINSENVFYNIQQLAGNKIGYIELLNEHKNQFVDEIIWIKGHGQPAAAKNVLNSRFEHILIFRNENKPKRTITTANFHGTISNYYEGSGNSSNEFSKVHAATFPIHLPEFIINNFCKKSVLDVFLGTGTTMVAAHQLKRKCYGMELDPKYCQVIIDRMKKLDPTLEIKRNGLPYETK